MGTVVDNGTHAADIELRRRQFMSQQSTVQTRRQQAVCVRRAYKRYGTKKNPFVILDGLNMTVPKGAIYGLLGASGCGKTTLLSCIIGRRRLNSGELWVLGGTPGSRGSGVPGPRVGYMPQELALYGEFSIRETLIYFGWLSGLTTSEIDEKLDFLIKFLMLPPPQRMVKSLSGGQQRRVSFAAALLHEPELLILDEPTVGVDPVLRQSIWDHLIHISKGGKTTIIITTHYIEEARQAHIIGLMRGGHFLAEESPDKLMMRYGTETLEEVFLKLSVLQNMGKRRRSSILLGVTQAIAVPPVAVNRGVVNDAIVLDDEPGEISGEFGDNVSISSRSRRVSIIPDEPLPENLPEVPPEEEIPEQWYEKFKIMKYRHMKTLVWKNFLWMWRNVGVMLFIVGLPVAQTVLFCLSIGHDAVGLHLSVANFELNNSKELCVKIDNDCNSTRLSCNFIKYMENKTMIMDYFDTVEGAKNAVVKGDAWAALIFKQNYSEALRERIHNGRYVEEWDIENSDIDVYQDKSNENIASLMFRDFYRGYQSFMRDYLTSCGINTKVGDIPVRFNTPVYGADNPNFTDFAAPGLILTTIFFLAVALTSGAMLIERNEGILERSLVNGITAIELLFSHVITQFLIMVGQTVLVLLFCFAVFNLTNNGFLPWIVLLTLLTGLCGMCFGFVVSCTCENERSATYFAMGSFLPIVMLCGIVWPIEGMHEFLQLFSVFLPLTKTTESMRAMLMRGWGITVPVVWAGFASTCIWAVIFLSISILVLKFKKG